MEAMETYFTNVELEMLLESVSYDCVRTRELIDKMAEHGLVASERVLTENLKSLDNLKTKLAAFIAKGMY